MSKKWARFVPSCEDWRDLEGDARALCLAIFRASMGPSHVAFTDDDLLDAMFELINAGLVVISFRIKKNGDMEGMIELPFVNDTAAAVQMLGGGTIH